MCRLKKVGIGVGLMAKLNYHHKLNSTETTTYINASAGIARTFLLEQGTINVKSTTISNDFFLIS